MRGWVRKWGGAACAAMTMAGLGALPSPAPAADAPPSSARLATAHLARQVELTCPADFARLCPDQAMADGRDMIICLKVYRADLSMNCRRAITAATRPAPASDAAPQGGTGG